MTGAPKCRVLLADDHAIVRHGVKLLLDDQPDFEVVAEAGDGAEALQAALCTELDLAILDVSMPRLTGLQATRRLRAQRPDLRILILSMHDNEQFFFESLRAGAGGYVLKSAAHEDLITACRAMMRGEPFIYPSAVTALIREYLKRGPDDVPEDPLTPRESEIVKLIAEGLSAKQIAETLYISQKTVDRHRTNVLEKLGLNDRVGLTRYAVRRGLIVP